jgi:flagellar biosynthesis GTPase FlhF
VSHFSEAKFDNRMIDHLVMDPARLRTLKALAKSFARLNVNEERMIEGQWSADFVRGKGNGLIFLLHGKPGVGKTCTAGKQRILVLPTFHLG